MDLREQFFSKKKKEIFKGPRRATFDIFVSKAIINIHRADEGRSHRGNSRPLEKVIEPEGEDEMQGEKKSGSGEPVRVNLARGDIRIVDVLVSGERTGKRVTDVAVLVHASPPLLRVAHESSKRPGLA